jgi:hypothetical protein
MTLKLQIITHVSLKKKSLLQMIAFDRPRGAVRINAELGETRTYRQENVANEIKRNFIKVQSLNTSQNLNY